MADMKVTPDGFPSGRWASFDFDSSSRVGNDLAHDIEQNIVADSLGELTEFLLAGGHSRLRQFTAFIEREMRVRAGDSKEERDANI
jgi:hypothetical protein